MGGGNTYLAPPPIFLNRWGGGPIHPPPVPMPLDVINIKNKS